MIFSLPVMAGKLSQPRRFRQLIGPAIEVGADDFGRNLRDDGIAKGAQFTHSGGNPMSQETNSGFNAPGFSVGSDGEAGAVPE